MYKGGVYASQVYTREATYLKVYQGGYLPQGVPGWYVPQGGVYLGVGMVYLRVGYGHHDAHTRAILWENKRECGILGPFFGRIWAERGLLRAILWEI